MTSVPGSAPVQLRVNLEIVRGHYNDAARLHFRSRTRRPVCGNPRHSYPDQRDRTPVGPPGRGTGCHTNLRDAALATMTAYEAGEADPLLQIRLVLSADNAPLDRITPHMSREMPCSSSC